MTDAAQEGLGLLEYPQDAVRVERLLTKPGMTAEDVLNSVEWEIRNALIGNPDKPAFRQDGVEFPKSWSQNATNIVAQKYFRGQLGTPSRESSVKQMVTRVAGTITQWGIDRGYFGSNRDDAGVISLGYPDHPASVFMAELTAILVKQIAAFNSPVWFNVGFEEHPQCSACFILSVADDIESILDWNTKEGKIFRGGSGSGINLSNIRGSMEPLSKGGTASGPVSFMRGTDSWAGTIKSGGKTRRAAKMVILDVDHPDIVEFITCKANEEDKAEALRNAGFDMSIDGDGFISIQYQNANNSVRVSDEFMRAVENDDPWQLTARVNNEPVGESIPARELMRMIAEAAWRCADPGVQYDTTINKWHTCPESGRINASNPCSEYMHVDDSACNLASINLTKFRKDDGTFDRVFFEHVVDVIFLAQEITVGTEEQPASSFPTEEIAVNARAFRQIGLGYTNLGAYLMANGIPYDSDRGRGTAAAITSLMTGRAYRRSAEIAGVMGPYDQFELNRKAHRQVMVDHGQAAWSAIEQGCAGDSSLEIAAKSIWDEVVELGDDYGYRNAQATVLAPTGTISFLMDCDTTGIEPDFSLVKFKELVGGGNMTIVNRTVALALRTLGYDDFIIGYPSDEVSDGVGILGHIQSTGSIIGAPGFDEKKHGKVFHVAVGKNAISWEGHVKMMGAVQPFISGAISKTVNMPYTSTVADIEEAYMEAWRLGVKALAIYRDGSKTAQALRTEAQSDDGSSQKTFSQKDVDRLVADAVKAAGGSSPVRRKMPRERKSITHKFTIGGHKGYITAGMYEDGTVGEIFLTDIGKEGSTLRGMMNAFATSISISLQYGVPLEMLVRKFAYMRFEPEGITGNPEINFAKSMPDYIMRWLASRFLDADIQEDLGIMTPEVRARKAASEAQASAINPQQGVLLVDDAAVAVASNGGSSGDAAAIAPIEPKVQGPVSPADLGPACDQCGGMMQRTGACYTCTSCGNNTGCG